jgi:hypothetical protein
MARAWITAGVVGALVAVMPARPADQERRYISEVRGDSVLQEQDAKSKELPKEPPGKEVPKAKTPPKPKDPVEPDAFARAPDTSGEAPAGSFSRMMGDWVGVMYADRIVQLPGYQVTTTTASTTQTRIVRRINSNGQIVFDRVTTTIPLGDVVDVKPATVTTRARVPVVTGGSFKIAENERPVPEDRIFLTYNYFQNVPGALPAPSTPVASVVGGNPVITQFVIPPINTYVQRQVIGFEATFLDGAASIGMRAPFLQQYGGGLPEESDLGDISFVLKFLAYIDGADAVSGGLVLTAPTGPPIETVAGNIHPYRVQPWVGGVATAGDFFAMGFLSAAIPTDSRDVTILFTDVQAGYLIYQNPFGGLVTWIAPMAEIHLTTPLNHRSGNGPLYVPDLVVLTQGLQVGLGMATSVAVGVAVPVTGPQPFDWEVMLQVNVRF